MNKRFLGVPLFALLTVCAEAVVYRPGLTQAKFNTNAVSFGTLTPEIMSSSTADVVPGAVMANVKATESNYSTQGYTNALSGLIWTWNHRYTTFGYAGEIFVNAGTTYTFGEHIDEGAAVYIAGEQVLSNGTSNVFTQSGYLAASTGWLPIEICIWDVTGNKGPSGGIWGDGLGLAYNIIDLKVQTPKESWSPIIDDGSMTFLRTTTDEIFVRVGKVSLVGGIMTVNVVTESPRAARLTVWLSDANGGEDPAAWGSNSQTMDIAAGSQSYSLDIPTAGLSAPEPWCGIRLESLDAEEVFIEWARPFQCGASPVVQPVIVNEVFYTNVITTAWLNYLGLDVNTADVFLELSLTADMTDVFRTVQLAEAIAAAPAEIAGFNLGELEPATTYFIRVRGEGDNGAIGFSDVTSFTTLTPSAPMGDCMLRSVALRSLGFDYQVTDYGLGAQECTEVWAEIATLEDFSDMQSTLLGSDIKGEFPIINSFVLPDLLADTQYFVRVRFRNLWELDMLTDPIVVSTFARPYEFSNIGAVNGVNGMDVFLSLVRIDSGVELDVELLLDDVSVQTWTPLTSTQKLTFNLGTVSGTHTVQYRINGTFEEASLPEEILQQTVSGEYNTYTAGTENDLFDFHFRPGESGRLPPPMVPERFYRVTNPSVAELQADELHLTALAPGGTGIELWQNTFTGAYFVARGSMIVVPPAIGNGKVFRFNERTRTGEMAWEDGVNWECLSHLGYAGYPQSADDIAMILITNRTPTILQFDTAQCALGGMYLGHFGRANASILFQSMTNAAGGFTMSRTDGKAPFIQATCGNSNVTTTTYFGSTDEPLRLNINLSQGLTVNGGFLGEERGPNWQQATFIWRAVTVDLPMGTMLKVVEGQPYEGKNQNSRFSFDATCAIRGGGLIWNDSAYAVNLQGDWSGFSGTLRDTGYGHEFYDRNANFQFYSTTTTNTTLEVQGFVARSLINQDMAGYSAVGINHGWSSPDENPGDRLPGGGIVMEGGRLDVRGEAKGGWTALVLTNHTQSLTIGRGLSFITVDASTTVDRPTNTLMVSELRHPGYGTLLLNELSMRQGGLRTYTTFGNCTEHMIGGGGTYDSGINSIIPWIVCGLNVNNNTWQFSTIDDTGWVRTNCVWKGTLNNNTEPLLNLTIDGTSLALSGDMTVNSLALNNNTHTRLKSITQCLGTNRTLTVTSGGFLFINNNSHFGRYDLPAEMAGSLVFPRTAYIHAVAPESNPHQIAAKITAPDSLVCGYLGALSLMNDQTGIRGKIYVNNGTLFLGYPDGSVGVQLDCDVQIVGGASKVCVMKSGALSPERNVIFEDVAGFAGKLELPTGVNESCHMLFAGDLENSLPRGTYGASGSGAEFIDDVHFSGTGILTVNRDTIIRPVIIHIF